MESPCVSSPMPDPEPKRRKTTKDSVSRSSTPLPYGTEENQQEKAEVLQESEPQEMGEAERVVEGASEVCEATIAETCGSCIVLGNEKRQLANKVKELREKLKNKRSELAKTTKNLKGKFCQRRVI